MFKTMKNDIFGQNQKNAEFSIVLRFLCFDIRYCFGFRYSDFEFFVCNQERNSTNNILRGIRLWQKRMY
jgi:hypothetical protein